MSTATLEIHCDKCGELIYQSYVYPTASEVCLPPMAKCKCNRGPIFGPLTVSNVAEALWDTKYRKSTTEQHLTDTVQSDYEAMASMVIKMVQAVFESANDREPIPGCHYWQDPKRWMMSL